MSRFPENVYGDEIVDGYWSFDGPHDDHATAQAVRAIGQLARYLANATGPGHQQSALPYAATGNRVVNGMASAAGSMVQILQQLMLFFEAQSVDPTLYDDRYDEKAFPARATAQLAAEYLVDAQQAALLLMEQLQKAAKYTTHLGNQEPPAVQR